MYSVQNRLYISLQEVLEGSDEPAVGLENIVEWWPSNDKVSVNTGLDWSTVVTLASD